MSNSGGNCSNCGDYGHTFKNCLSPVSSYGIIAFRIKPNNITVTNSIQAEKLTTDARSLTGYENQQIEFLLIQRKDSIGFVELVRGKYKLDDISYIKDQIAGMTPIERERILTLPFETLWADMWGSNSNSKQFTNEYETSKKKIMQLKESGTLAALITEIPAVYTTPEWGFPKGRRNPREDNITCAMREFNEETGLRPYQYKVVENMDPIRETFFGNNHVHYTHVYYLAVCSSNLEVIMNRYDNHMVREVGERIKSKQILLSVDEKVKVKLTREGYNPMFGARPLRRLVTKYIEDLISENILKNTSTKKIRTIKIQLNEDDQIVVKKEESVLV
jgi:ADP-ribose pyrophosphatase YjhB (NUDIX family)